MERTIEQIPPALQILSLENEFKDLLTEVGKSALNLKCNNTVLEYIEGTNGGIVYFDGNMDVGTKEMNSQVKKAISIVDPNAQAKCSIILYGGIIAKAKYKDREKIDPTVPLKEIAAIYEDLLSKGFIHPVLFVPPFSMNLSMYYSDGKMTIYKDSEGNLRKYPTNAAQIMNFNTYNSIQQDILTQEEVDELIFKQAYFLYVFPTKKFEEQAKEAEGDGIFRYETSFNNLMGKSLFVREGELPVWEIEF